jgi:hypothetical protein
MGKSMKRHVLSANTSVRFTNRNLISLCIALASGAAALAQGTVTFNGWAGLSSTYYEELGILFQLVIPAGTTGRDDLAIIAGGGNTPRDGTDFMGWFRQHNPYNYVSLSAANGSLFGLTSVWLADPTSPSSSVDTITFIGYKTDGTTVTEVFTVGGNNATTFQNYTFDSDLASGLTSVQIDSSRWAMDNLVFTVPEPSGLALLGIDGLMLALRRRGNRTKSVDSTL